MKSKTRQPKRLKLHRETLYALDALALREVAAGASVGCTTGTCPKITVLTFTDCPNTAALTGEITVVVAVEETKFSSNARSSGA